MQHIARFFVRAAALGLWFVAIAGLVNISSQQAALAQESAGNGNASGELGEAVEAGRDALRRAEDFPWYDREADDFRAVDLPDRQASDENRKSRWEYGKRRTTSLNPNLPRPSFFSGLLNALVWMLVILLIVLLVAGVVWAFMKAEGRKTGAASEDADDLPVVGEADRIEKLPFKVARPQSDLLAEARRHYEAGRYGEAVVYLFSYQLVQLDKHQFIRLAKGKTNRQYLREVRPQAELRSMLERTMIAFEDVFFGHRELARDRFETCWSQLDAFHQKLEKTTSPA
jgi:hypothetical protein